MPRENQIKQQQGLPPFSSGYHALLGRDAFMSFQAIPHYGYIKLKMPGPNGIITLASDPDVALRAENKTAALALEYDISRRYLFTAFFNAPNTSSGRMRLRLGCAALRSGQGRHDTRQTTQVHLF